MMTIWLELRKILGPMHIYSAWDFYILKMMSQAGNWIKYAFMERREDKLFYCCAIPRKIVVPDGFLSKQIAPYKYMVVEHIGSMDKIYETYSKIYKELLPNTEYTPVRENFLHFERYDARFHWNRDNSIIEIWVPIRGEYI